MNAEARAKEIVEACRAYNSDGDLLFIACDRAEALIATALRQAGNDKLEEAAQRLIHRAYRLLPPDTQLVAKCAAEIRSLKFKD